MQTTVRQFKEEIANSIVSKVLFSHASDFYIFIINLFALRCRMAFCLAKNGVAVKKNFMLNGDSPHDILKMLNPYL